MKVSLISVTPDAWNLLIGTKSTRMRGKDPHEMTDAERYEHWSYMLDTIRSPFEFVDYIFLIEGVSKNMTHQLVRTRTGAYQQETSRALEIGEIVRPEAFEWPESVTNPEQDVSSSKEAAQALLASYWDSAIIDAKQAYADLISSGAALQDARAVLPSNMATTISAKFNLRTLSDMSRVRLCTRTQGEYQQAFRLMRELVLKEHPWAEPLLQVACVATGQCAFPRHGKEHCRFFKPWMDLSAQKEALRKEFWETELTTNNPVAHDGKSTG